MTIRLLQAKNPVARDGIYESRAPATTPPYNVLTGGFGSAAEKDKFYRNADHNQRKATPTAPDGSF
ncbi:MAG: hypothetical protein ACLUSP_02190 [Christensenellales bacterium]